jgi:hypothetical protein
LEKETERGSQNHFLSECTAINLFIFVFSDRFDELILKIFFEKIKKHYFSAFPSKKHFEKKLLPHFQTPPQFAL